MSRPLLLTAYLLSGFCALIFENVWIHEFSLVFGSTAHALSVVVAVFLGGLALGSRLFARVSLHAARPVRLYGWLEVVVGLYGFAVPALVRAFDPVHAALFPPAAGTAAASPAEMTLARIAAAVVVLIIPTVCMGGTLPLLIRHVVTRVNDSARSSGLLYGLNATGAALGSLAAGYLLLRWLGVSGTNRLAAGINLAIGLTALALSFAGERAQPRAVRLSEPPPPDAPQGGAQAVSPRPVPARTVVTCFAVGGFVSMAYQVIWLRHLTFFFRDTIYLYSGIITLFVLGIGIGSAVAGRMRRVNREPVAAFGLMQLGIGVLTVVALYAPVPFVLQLVELGERGGAAILPVLVLLLLGPTLLMGAAFPAVAAALTRRVDRAGETIGRAYAWNTAGSILGILAAGFVLLPGPGLQITLVALFGLNMACAAWLRRRWALPLALLLAFVGVTLLWPGARLPRALLERRLGSGGGSIVAVQEGQTGTTWVVRSGADDISLMENGVIIGRRGRGSWIVPGFVPFIVSDRVPARVLGMAFGAGQSTVPVRLFDEVTQLDLIDISADNVDAALTYFPENTDLRGDPRVRIFIDDAYSYLKRTRSTYDHAFVEPTPPMFSFRNAALYSREFYALARSRLAEAGTFAQVLPLRQLSEHETRSIIRTFADVFPEGLLWWNNVDAVLVGSLAPLSLDAGEITSRLGRPAVHRALSRASSIAEYQFPGNFLAGLLMDGPALERFGDGGEIYTDDRLGLKFSTGTEVGFAAIEAIHAELAPWPDLRARHPGLASPALPPEELAVRRERLMTLCYRSDPERFATAFLEYVRRHSRDPRADLTLLIRFLEERGLTGRADEVRGLQQRLR